MKNAIADEYADVAFVRARRTSVAIPVDELPIGQEGIAVVSLKHHGRCSPLENGSDLQK